MRCTIPRVKMLAKKQKTAEFHRSQARFLGVNKHRRRAANVDVVYDSFRLKLPITANAINAANAANQTSDHTGTGTPRIGGNLSAQPPFA